VQHLFWQSIQSFCGHRCTVSTQRQTLIATGNFYSDYSVHLYVRSSILQLQGYSWEGLGSVARPTWCQTLFKDKAIHPQGMLVFVKRADLP